MLEIFRKPSSTLQVNPRFRAYGKARIDIAKRAESRADWDHLWKKPTHPFPFSWGSAWKQCIEYKVADFPAEVGFFIDILGFPVNAFDPDYAMFTSPGGDFYFSVVPTRDGEQPTPLGAIRLQFMVQHIVETAIELERRGVKFNQLPARVADNSSFLIGSFQTPNGIGVELWGFDAGKETIKFDSQEEMIDQLPEHNGTKLPSPGVPEGTNLILTPTEQQNNYGEIEYQPDEQEKFDDMELIDGDEY
jgi:catechol 2,3-dioxygenase-like lactoylglutathione lyase family enzyme